MIDLASVRDAVVEYYNAAMDAFMAWVFPDLDWVLDEDEDEL